MVGDYALGTQSPNQLRKILSGCDRISRNDLMLPHRPTPQKLCEISAPQISFGQAIRAAMATPPVERLELDPERPKFLLLEPPTAEVGSAVARSAKKPRIGELEELSTLSSVRAFLAEASTAPRAAVASGATVAGHCDPEIVAVPEKVDEILLPKADCGETSSEEEAAPPVDLAVEMHLGLGVLDVLGSTEPLEKRGVAVAAGHLKEAEEQPLVQEVESHELN
eukprot:s4008_g6.t1